MFPLNNQVPESSLKIIGTRSQLYSGQVVVPTTEQSFVLGRSENIEVFAHLLKYGVIYHSTSYERSSKGKRCSRYQNVNGALCFGKLELFVKSPHAYAFIRQLEQLKTSLIKVKLVTHAALRTYANADLLNSYMVPVNLSTDHCQLMAVQIDDIVSKMVLVSSSDCVFIRLSLLHCSA